MIHTRLLEALQTRDEYHTLADMPRHLADRLTLNTRFFFLSRFVRLTFTTRKDALRGNYDTAYWISSSHDVFRYIEESGGRFHLTGIRHIRNAEGPAVFVSNHMSTLETMVFPGLFAPLREVTFVVKDALVEHWVFGPVMRSRHPIIVARSNPREDLKIVMEQGLELLAKGNSIILFPQSTRKVEFVPAEFNSLGVKLAGKAGVPVIPVAIKTDFWEHGRYTKYLGTINRKKPIHIAVGEPIRITGTGKEAHQQVLDFITAHLKSWAC